MTPRLLSRWLALILVGTLPLVAQEPATETTPTSRAQDDAALFEMALEHSKAHGGRAVLVIHDGKVVLQDYENGFEAGKAFPLGHATAGFWGVAAMAAVQDRLLALDEKVSRTLPEWINDPRLALVTVRQILTHGSGLDDKQTLHRFPDKGDRYAEALRTLKCTQIPAFRPNPSAYYILGAFLQRKLESMKLDKSPLEYLKRRIFAPIGLDVADWVQDRVGNPGIPVGASLTIENWAKFGELIRQRGAWNGKPVVDESLFEQTFDSSEHNRAFGLGVWIGLQKAAGRGERGMVKRLPKDLIVVGGDGNRLYVSPASGLVVVRFGEKSKEFSDVRFLTPISRALLGGIMAQSPDRVKKPEPDEEAPKIDDLDGRVKRALANLDKDQNGTIEKSEISPNRTKFFARADADGDGVVTEQELRTLFEGK